jgi:SAM-dependent methyltransferase
MIDANAKRFEKIYASNAGFLRYPSEMLVRFHNAYLREHIPAGRVLDYGCGSGNDIRLFRDEGYETHGIEVAPGAIALVEQNIGEADRIQIVDPHTTRLPFPDDYFDVIVANEVLYYFAEESRIRSACKEFRRCLRHDGAVYFTMMGSPCHYVTRHGQFIEPDLCKVEIEGDVEYIFIVRDEKHLSDLFSQFEPVSIGYSEHSLFTSESNFHWIFVGKKLHCGKSP